MRICCSFIRICCRCFAAHRIKGLDNFFIKQFVNSRSSSQLPRQQLLIKIFIRIALNRLRYYLKRLQHLTDASRFFNRVSLLDNGVNIRLRDRLLLGYHWIEKSDFIVHFNAQFLVFRCSYNICALIQQPPQVVLAVIESLTYNV